MGKLVSIESVLAMMGAGATQQELCDWLVVHEGEPTPPMESMGKRKLYQLQGDGYIVNGVAIFNPDTGRRGLVDRLGYVGWVGSPTPGGQGDALVTDAMVEVAHSAYWAHPDDSGEDRPCMRAALKAALAVRQPVDSCTESECARCRTHPDHRGEIGHAGISDFHQPVGVATVVHSKHFDKTQCTFMRSEVPEGTKLYAAPPAQAVDLNSARHEGHDCAIRYVLGYLNGTGDMASTQYGEILNSCGRESIIRSAIRDGELEFTGLGEWVTKYGTDAERALIDGKA